jgi:hypothetical protein
MLIFTPGSHAQRQETVNADAILPDDSAELENRIRHKKFDEALPRVMRDNNIDMWIHIMQPWIPDPLRFELGASSAVFIFTDRGENRIERIAYSGQVRIPRRTMRSSKRVWNAKLGEMPL